MKLMKWMTVTALATATVFGGFVELAEAFTFIANKPEGGRFDSLEVDYEFTLLSTIEDKDMRSPNEGFFPNAIIGFTGGIDDVDDFFIFDEIKVVNSLVVSPDEIDNPDEFIDEALTLNLRKRFISQGKNILLPMTKINAIAFDSREPIIASNNRIEYVLSGERLEEKGVNELTLIIEDLTGIDNPKKTVNSLDLMIDNQLLGRVSSIRVSGRSSDSSEIISNEGTICDPSDIEGSCKPVRVESVSVSIPESSPSNSLLVLGILGAGLGLKRKFK